MKLVTINTHSLIEDNYPQKLEQFVDFICREQPDLIAMQEVNQSIDAPVYDNPLLGYSPASDIMPVIREDNHALQAAVRIHAHRLPYHWTWLPVKLGYSKYDEGMAIFSKTPITQVDHFYISTFRDYNNWKTRQVLGLKIADCDDWFYTMHMGWWDDQSERFLDQWKVLNCCVASKRMCGNIWLMGDFNAPDVILGQSYEHITACGWIDTYQIAQFKDCGITVPGVIDGWREKLAGKKVDGMRLDYIWCSKRKEILSSQGDV